MEKHKRWKKRIHRGAVMMIAAFAICLLHMCPVKAAETQNVTADILRQAQQGIVNWNLSQAGGEEQVLTGSRLDDAGSAGSDWVAFDLGRMGQEDNQAAYLYRMRQYVENIYQDLDGNLSNLRPTDLHRIVLTIKACGGDPTAFGKNAEGNSINLVADSTWNCIFDDLGKQGLNGYIWALIAMDSGSYEVPADAVYSRDHVITAILSRQQADGGFSLQQSDESDSDMTAMALTALAPYQDSEDSYTFENVYTKESVTCTVRQAADTAFAFLSSMQQDDGSMITYQERTAESTSWTLAALSAWNRDARSEEAFIKNNHTLLDGLMEFRLEDGSFIHSLDAAEAETEGNAMASYQACYALEACARQIEGKNRLFDLTDAASLSEETITAAGANLPEISESVEKDAETAVKDTQNRTVLLTAVIAGVIVLLVIIFMVLLLKNRKKKKALAKPFEEDDDDEDDW